MCYYFPCSRVRDARANLTSLSSQRVAMATMRATSVATTERAPPRVTTTARPLHMLSSQSWPHHCSQRNTTWMEWKVIALSAAHVLKEETVVGRRPRRLSLHLRELLSARGATNCATVGRRVLCRRHHHRTCCHAELRHQAQQQLLAHNDSHQVHHRMQQQLLQYHDQLYRRYPMQLTRVVGLRAVCKLSWQTSGTFPRRPVLRFARRCPTTRVRPFLFSTRLICSQPMQRRPSVAGLSGSAHSPSMSCQTRIPTLGAVPSLCLCTRIDASPPHHTLALTPTSPRCCAGTPRCPL
jgi:hypothetical protein